MTGKTDSHVDRLIDEFIVLLSLFQSTTLSPTMANRFVALNHRLWRHLPESYKKLINGGKPLPRAHRPSAKFEVL